MIKEIYQELKRILPCVQFNVSLKNHTTFKIGGRARYFFEAKSKEDLIEAVIAAKKMRLPFFILGNGSNLLAADDGFDGLVIKIKNTKINPSTNSGLTLSEAEGVKMQNDNIKCKIIEADAGTSLGKLVNILTEKGLTGMEWAAGVPGTVGGAIYGNAGAFGKAMANVVKSVEIIDAKTTNKSKIFQNKDCEFGYRDSIFKHNKNLIILSAKLQLKKDNRKEIEEKIREYLNYRKENQPLNFPSAGSVFNNPPGFSAGELIEKCGLKGKRIGNAKISEKHANFVVNLGGAKSTDVKKLIVLAKKEVKNKFKIKLEEEIQYL